MATINLGRVGFVNKGNYAQSISYKVNDIVKYNKNLYACIEAHTSSVLLDATKWQVWIEADDYTGITAPTLTILSFTVNESSINSITIDAYDANVTYIVSAQSGTINSIVGNTITYQAPSVLADSTDTISIYYKIGTLLSETRDYTLNVLQVPIEPDTTIQVVDFTSEASFNNGFDII